MINSGKMEKTCELVRKPLMIVVFINIVLVFIAFVSVFSNIVKNPQFHDNKSIKSLGVKHMKKILLSLIEKFEKNTEYLPFDTHEPIVTNSRK
jgi:nitrogen fixation-related uncharacterized protein